MGKTFQIKALFEKPRNVGYLTILIIMCCTACVEKIDKEISSENNTISSTRWEIIQNDFQHLEQLNNPSGFKFTSNVPSKFAVSQSAMFTPGEYFLMAKLSIDLKEGNFYFKAGNKRITISDHEVTCNRTLFTFVVQEYGLVDFAFGVTSASVGTAVIEYIGVVNVEYKRPSLGLDNPRTRLIQQQLGISDIPNNEIDTWVDSMAYNVNRAFLESNTEKGHDLLVAYQSDIFADSSTRYLNRFMNKAEDRLAYCQKSSLSLDEIIRSFGIPTRQLHWQKDCTGIHQFLEYWNEEDQTWKIIDPFYGIRYVNNKGEYIGFEKIEELVRSGTFAASNIKRINIGKSHYSEEEIMAGWEAHDLAVHVNNW